MSRDPFVNVADLKPGDMIDLEGDLFADPERADPYLASQYATVDCIEQETRDCVRVDFEEGPSIGFPTSHRVRFGGPKYPQEKVS